MSDLDTDLSKSLKVKCNIVVGLHILGFLVMLNSNIWLISAPIRDQNLSDIECDLVKCDIVSFDSPHLLLY